MEVGKFKPYCPDNKRLDKKCIRKMPPSDL
jgi:hypothetical protein